jgi:hypothetical protein
VLHVGHAPSSEEELLRSLDPAVLRLFQSFQSNLLSLVSHELRTPLMGILNALSLLEQEAAAQVTSPAGESPPGPASEWLAMASRNARRLHETLSSLLDLAELDCGMLRATLREVDPVRLASARVQAVTVASATTATATAVTTTTAAGVAHEPLLRFTATQKGDGIFLADPKRLGRAIDLTLGFALENRAPGSEVELRWRTLADCWELVCEFSPDPNRSTEAREAWSQALAASQAGISPFAGVARSESGFLARSAEGLGAELLLVHALMKLHEGEFRWETTASAAAKVKGSVSLVLRFPRRGARETLLAVLRSRVARIDPEGDAGTGSLGVAVLSVEQPDPPGGAAGRAVVLSEAELCAELRARLFRSSDLVVPDGSGHLVLLLEDCRASDAPRLLERLRLSMLEAAPGRARGGLKLRWGVVSVPEDGLDPELLLGLAASRLAASGSVSKA